ncbi:CAT RNA binding domain-containing protein [Clostridium arbusti]
MNIDKIINNNLVRAFHDNNKEVIVMGCGIGYKKR